MKGLFIFPVLLILLFGTPAFAGFADGKAAFDKGDFATALKEWGQLAETGDANAQYYLGLMYYFGYGVYPDYKIAIKWYRLSAENGNANAQYNLGAVYYLGSGVLQDYKAAFKWIKLAAEQGNEIAQIRLGGMYKQGQVVTQDYLRSHMWYNIAGSEDGRGEVAKEMSPADVLKAQDLASKCVAKNYKDC